MSSTTLFTPVLLAAAVCCGTAHATEKAESNGQPSDAVARWLKPQHWIRDTTGPILGLGAEGQFDDTHLLTPCVALENNRFTMWYTGSRQEGGRMYQLGMATSRKGKEFEKTGTKPIFSFGDNRHSILTPTLLRDPSGNVLREDGKLRMWYAAADFKGAGVHRLHTSTSTDGVKWSKPSAPLVENLYAPTIIKEGDVYRMWFIDVGNSPWVVRHATSPDGLDWQIDEQVCLTVDQDWEHKNLFYPTVVKCDGVYLMWYGSYWKNYVESETDTTGKTKWPPKTALGCAVSEDGLSWIKNPHNPVFRPDETRPWESHYTTSQSVMRLPDGTWRIWYSSRKKPPHVNKYFSMGTARWVGPTVKPESEERDAAEETSDTKQALRGEITQMLGIPGQRVPLAANKRGELQHDGLVIEKWVFTSEPGSRIPALLYRPASHGAPMPAVVLTYGHGGSKSAPAYQYIAQLYAKCGMAVLAMDPLGEEERNAHGKLYTREHDGAKADAEAWRLQRSVFGKLLWDAMRGVDFLEERTDIDKTRIGVAGNSLGGALALWMAALEPRLSASVVSGWAIDDRMMVFGKRCTCAPTQRLRKICTWEGFMALPAPHCSVLILNGDADVIIDQSNDGGTWRGTRHFAARSNLDYQSLGSDRGVSVWFEPSGGHRPYPAHKHALAWLAESWQLDGIDAESVAALPDVNFGHWAHQYGFRFDRLYDTDLHLLGATVAGMDIRPFQPEELACLRPDEVGTADFTISGWLERCKQKASTRESK
ncbi:acetylxylan esterase [Aeoliella sp.]|uniref:acetylxylan esterase n=1 Tax=Aeoliella sp. TaxID=2795800 RepID=UPI003CCC2381